MCEDDCECDCGDCDPTPIFYVLCCLFICSSCEGDDNKADRGGGEYSRVEQRPKPKKKSGTDDFIAPGANNGGNPHAEARRVIVCDL
jgi:hypothetical protein